jgi:hypothetical protein
MQPKIKEGLRVIGDTVKKKSLHWIPIDKGDAGLRGNTNVYVISNKEVIVKTGGSGIKYARYQYYGRSRKGNILNYRQQGGKPIRVTEGFKDSGKGLSTNPENRYKRAWRQMTKEGKMKPLSKFDGAPKWFERYLAEPNTKSILTKKFIKVMNS